MVELKHVFSENPIGSMYDIFSYIWLIFVINVGKISLRIQIWSKKRIFRVPNPSLE